MTTTSHRIDERFVSSIVLTLILIIKQARWRVSCNLRAVGNSCNDK